MFPKRIAPYIAGFITGSFMSFIMSGIVTAVNTGLTAGFLMRWLGTAFPVAWVCAVPLAIIAAMFMPHILKYLIRQA